MTDRAAKIASGSEPVAVSLDVADHRRDILGTKYVYPVVSRRAGGVSIGVNLNVNNACNWECVYCQVPDLKRGAPPDVDLPLLADELDALLDRIKTADFMKDQVSKTKHSLVDVAFSGNGEPTASRQFEAAVEVVVGVLKRRGVLGIVPVRLITNGSLMHRADVLRGVRLIGDAGEVWFKVDRVSGTGLWEVNRTKSTPGQIKRRLLACASVAPTWVQSCWFGVDRDSVDEEEFQRYLDFLSEVAADIRGVYLYGIARQSLRPAADRLIRLSAEAMDGLAERIKERGVTVRVSP